MSCITHAQVVASHPDRLVVRPLPKPLCQGCAAYGACRMAVGQLRGRPSEIEIPLTAPITVSPGETVELSITGTALRGWVLRAYGAPLAVFLSVIGVGATLHWHELGVACLAGVSALGVFCVMTRHAQIRIQVRA